MGFNTSMIIMNDAQHSIEEDPDFGSKVVEAIKKLTTQDYPSYGADISSGPYVNAATVIETHHADFTTLLAVGGNFVTVLGQVYESRHNETETQIKLLEMLAKKLGYTISPKENS